MTVRSALPTTPFYLTDLGYGVFTYRPDLVPGQPIYLDAPGVPGGRLVNSAAFAKPATARQGGVARNSIRGSRLFQVDLGLSRDIPLPRGLSARARVDVFNVLNRPHFGLPGMYMDDALFGQPTTTLANDLGRGGPTSGLNPLFQIGGPRSVQLSLRLAF